MAFGSRIQLTALDGITAWDWFDMSGNQMKTCQIDTGDLVTSRLRGPDWTPYAQAIAKHYPIQVPWYLTKTVNLEDTGAVPPRFTQITTPQLHDVLILGMSALVFNTPLQDDNGNFIYLNITDQETGIPWVAPNTLGFAPLPAFAGVNILAPGIASLASLPVTPIIKLPEAFFLPRGVQLKLDWTAIAASVSLVNRSATLTMIGVQLINPKLGSKAPRSVVMPNGDEIIVGSRLPWFGCVPFGARATGATPRSFNTFTLPIGQQLMQFFPPIDCNVELHDTYGNFLVSPTAYDGLAGAGFPTPFLTMKFTDMGAQNDWTPGLSPTPAVLGKETDVEPVMPFPKPVYLETGHRTAFTMQNNTTAVAGQVNQGTVTIRGVRLCEY
jgi:hypothetical protein